MGDIGPNPKEVEFEPFPQTEPVKEPSRREHPERERTPQPAPAEPEKVPA